MASYRYPILIQKQDEDTEIFADYMNIHANINKVGGKEYEKAKTNISNSTFNFKVRYCEKLKPIIFNTQIYRIVYDGYYFDITNVDRYAESKTELTIVGEVRE